MENLLSFFVANKNTDSIVQNSMSTETLIVQSVPAVMSNCCELNRFKSPQFSEQYKYHK